MYLIEKESEGIKMGWINPPKGFGWLIVGLVLFTLFLGGLGGYKAGVAFNFNVWLGTVLGILLVVLGWAADAWLSNYEEQRKYGKYVPPEFPKDEK